jgi:hypothetical protein
MVKRATVGETIDKIFKMFPSVNNITLSTGHLNYFYRAWQSEQPVRP